MPGREAKGFGVLRHGTADLPGGRPCETVQHHKAEIAKMKRAALLCITLLVMPAFMAEASYATLTQSEKNYCRKKAEKYADEKSLGTTAGGAIAGAVAGGIIGGLITGGKGSGVGTGAAVGAGVGGVGGAARGSQKWNNYYWNKYNNCIQKYY